ncbi:hypothetical protein [Mesorhizobium sp. M6A.T.Ce.TU.002.03.1.1]|uniref:hypothetical protein n=1 Tax=Mesorhizobium sp. M6A.T.Ce.TU.002.03.1.1 TaxID=2496782 RepID=UPI001FE0F956|nr:hypothetical protein [Mesorhizobium sp. M6A.T.Ce.TU.002.03.1.1]
MATIPLQLAQRRLDTGNVVRYPQGSPIGGAMQDLGGELSAVSERFQQRKEQQEAFDAEIARRKMMDQIAQAEADVAGNAAPDGAGLHDAMYGQVDPRSSQVVKPGLFDTLFDDALPKIPESQRANFARQKETIRAMGSERMAARQQARRDEYEQDQWTKVENISTNSIARSDPNDTANFEEIRQHGLDLIAKIGNPLARQAAEVAWRSNTAKAWMLATIGLDPKRAAEMLGATQAGDRTKDDTAAVGGEPRQDTASPSGSKGDRVGQLTPEERTAQAFQDDIAPEDRPALVRLALAVDAARQVDTRANISLAEQNAPEAIKDTGAYDGPLPTPEQFVNVHGATEGDRRFQLFNRAVNVSRQFHDMRDVPNNAIDAMVNDANTKAASATPEEGKARHDAIAAAADLTFKARQGDPGGYVRRAFAKLDAAWNNLSKLEDYQVAIVGSIAAQQQMGFKTIQPLPNSVAERVVDTLRDQNRPPQDQDAVLRNVLIATPREQRRAVLDHLLRTSVSKVADNTADRSLRAAVVDPMGLLDLANTPLGDGHSEQHWESDHPISHDQDGDQALSWSDWFNRKIPTYGIYGGPGWTGGTRGGGFDLPPFDIQDGFYKQHDGDYRDAKTPGDVIAADRKLVASLKTYLDNEDYMKDPALKTDEERNEASTYASRAMKLFQGKIAGEMALHIPSAIEISARDDAQRAYDYAQSAVGQAQFGSRMSFGNW